MNKILISTRKISNEDIHLLEITENFKYIVEGNVNIKEIQFKEKQFEGSFLLEENAELTVESILEFNNIKGKISFVSTNFTKLNVRFGIHSKKENDFTIENTITGNNNISEIILRVTCEENSKTILKTIGVLEKNTKENEFLEDMKYLNEYPGNIICFPELFVSSNEAIANHNMTVASIDEESLFYLESKGISEYLSKKLIRENFLKSVIRKEE